MITETEWKDYGRDLEHNITTLSWRFSCCLFWESSRRSHKKCCGSLMEWLWKTSCLFQKHSRYVDKYFIFVYCCLTAWRPSTNLRFFGPWRCHFSCWRIEEQFWEKGGKHLCGISLWKEAQFHVPIFSIRRPRWSCKHWLQNEKSTKNSINQPLALSK